MIPEYPEEIPCCGKCRSIPGVCALRHQCSCHPIGLTRAQAAVTRRATRNSIQDHWPEEAL
ncbi:hypothetical protein AVL63_02715 [Nesterenkonia jeotgali]|uniref:Uncharacterized protein n=1 Tax=Nesterenkonia jeotgali TaxID=317018 RepID=A0A0W8IGB4_9MICC|nr:hypothetical protein AVL63_02715 [Nesterenkonia jeotgali]